MSPVRPSNRFDYQFYGGRILVVAKLDGLDMWAYGTCESCDVVNPMDFINSYSRYVDDSIYPKMTLVIRRVRWMIGVPPKDFDEAERMSRVAIPATPEMVDRMHMLQREQQQKALPASTAPSVEDAQPEIEDEKRADAPDFEVT